MLVLDVSAVLTPFEKFSPGRLLIRGDRIEAAGVPSDLLIPDGAERIELPDLTLVPGFIDPHVHGCAGFDVMDATRDSLDAISKALASYGTTAFLPTTVSAPADVLDATLDRLARLLGSETTGAKPLGIHLEGPFLNVQKRGTHQPGNVLEPDATLLSNWIRRAAGALKLLTMAPELEGAGSVATLARKSGITVAMGHSDATFSEAIAATDGGVCYAVHTFNAMRQFSHRDPGIVGAVLSDDRVFAEIIADGIHVAPEVVRIFARSKGPSRIVLATDATSATGMPDGEYALGKSHVHVENGVCRDTEGRLAGSTLTQDRALRNLIAWTDMRLDDALLALTTNPAEALALEGHGRIESGAVADLTLLDQNLEVARTYVSGKLVFAR
ncbi:MAG TPA: N-acetylglucosamine-6-phosphate deacetylase [Terriglobia bacterium]|nr:N-acetylglucosamine-6-phosphate deacetylase [Terriglobia bacterium]